MVVQTVKEITRKGELVMLIPAQLTGCTESMETGRSVLLNVTEVLKQEAENVTTLLLSMVVQPVKEGASKRDYAKLNPASCAMILTRNTTSVAQAALRLAQKSA